MSKNKLPLLIMFFLFTLIPAKMNAQQHILADQQLSIQQQSMVTIAALTATGDLDNLKKQLNTGLDAGITINEIKEALVQLYAYCGFPRSLNGISTFMAVLEERKSKVLTINRKKRSSQMIISWINTNKAERHWNID